LNWTEITERWIRIGNYTVREVMKNCTRMFGEIWAKYTFVCVWRHNRPLAAMLVDNYIYRQKTHLFYDIFWNWQPCSWHLKKVSVSNACNRARVFWNVNQDGGQMQTTYCIVLLFLKLYRLEIPVSTGDDWNFFVNTCSDFYKNDNCKSVTVSMRV
jgi:hypothetical protein